MAAPHAGAAEEPEPNLPPNELCYSSYARACSLRRAAKRAATEVARSAEPSSAPSPSAAAPSAPLERPLLLTNCRLLDAAAGRYMDEPYQVLLHGGKVAALGAAAPGGGDEGTLAAAAGLAAPAVVVDCGGAVVMPGLCDAHVHATAASADLAALRSLPESYVAARAGAVLGGMLGRGFTTVRDAGGADFGLAQAVEEGLVLGPRLLFTGHALSQTGGHGDFRGRGEDACACGAALRGIGRVCDGDAEVRRAARDELRRGAHCVKVMASGGVASPTDRLTNTQFGVAELAAIVEEAAAAGSYVCAHAYTPPAISRAVQAGVRSIEHGNYLDEPTARLMADKGVFLVPTLVTYQELARGGAAAGMPRELVAKVGDAVEAGLRSLGVAAAAGVTMVYGSDLLGDLHPAQAGEFALRCRVLPSAEVLRSATFNAAQLFGMEHSLGRIAPGFDADLLLLAPGVDPLTDAAALAAPGGAAVAAVWKGGLLAKAPRGPAAAGAAERAAGAAGSEGAAAWSGLNMALFGEGRGEAV
ncbi:hypothetical protein HYH03_018874 [Edaphochlamys debaryana]|uniref:Amidohydrolase-related domain-containing protein n=1 Tax=Edaphochlamys debaryana TaxID=47281 RepID=A0A835XF20_9CHLO|nr:hypothetical protein HYH03_018874 [Edaphochlamys debaryana]|eukprot:KAG2482174.1 hypothetical protein HYH03_018874 [Edaphochlamys debaryana]